MFGSREELDIVKRGARGARYHAMDMREDVTVPSATATVRNRKQRLEWINQWAEFVATVDR